MECPCHTEIVQRQERTEHLHICLGCFIAATIEVSFSPLSYYSSAMEMNPFVAVFTLKPLVVLYVFMKKSKSKTQVSLKDL